MPVRRDRTYQLALISSDGKSRLHLRTRFPEHDLRSQVIYRTSPGGPSKGRSPDPCHDRR